MGYCYCHDNDNQFIILGKDLAQETGKGGDQMQHLCRIIKESFLTRICSTQVGTSLLRMRRQFNLVLHTKQ